jgi:hypothetical protein
LDYLFQSSGKAFLINRLDQITFSRLPKLPFAAIDPCGDNSPALTWQTTVMTDGKGDHMQGQAPARPAGSVAAPNTASTTAYAVHYDAPPLPSPITWYEKPWVPALVALLGVLIGLWVKWRSEKHERRLAIKEKIYLKTLETIHELPIHVTSLSNPTVALKDIQLRIGEHLAIMAQTEVVATMNLIEAMADFKDLVLSKQFEMLTKRTTIERNKVLIEINDKQVAHNNELLSQIRKTYLKSTPEQDKRLSEEWNLLTKHSNDLLSENGAIFQTSMNISLEIARDANALANMLMKHKSKILKLMRKDLKELGEKFDDKKYTDIQRKTSKIAGDSFEQVIKQAQDTFNVSPKAAAPPSPPDKSPT